MAAGGGAAERIRPAVAGDAAACAAILNAWIDATDWMPRVHTPEAVEAFCRDLVLADREVWVAGDPVAGFMAVEAGTITALYLATPGRGLGRAFLDHAKARHGRLELRTFEANTGARRFYEREGFRADRHSDGDNEEGLPDILYRWERGA